jgi:hypothetical protein
MMNWAAWCILGGLGVAGAVVSVANDFTGLVSGIRGKFPWEVPAADGHTPGFGRYAVGLVARCVVFGGGAAVVQTLWTFRSDEAFAGLHPGTALPALVAGFAGPLFIVGFVKQFGKG